MPNVNDLSHPNLIHRYSASSISGSTLTDLKGSANATLVNTSIVTIDGDPYINLNGTNAYIDYGFLTNRPQAKLPVTLYIKFRLPDTSRRNIELVLCSTATSTQSGFLIAYDDRRLSGGDALITTRRFRAVRYIGDWIVVDESGYTNDGLFDIDGPLGIGLISDGTTQQVAVNAQLFSPITLSTNNSTSQTRHTASGSWLNPSASFLGRLQISDVFVFDRALTQEEIADLYSPPSPPAPEPFPILKRGPYNLGILKSLSDKGFKVTEVNGLTLFNSMTKDPKTLYFIWDSPSRFYIQQINIGALKIAEEMPL
jgi:hypothetical protein